MSKTIKNALTIFTLICVIMLLVVIVELIRLNRGSADGEIKQSSPPTQQQTDNGSSTESPSDSSPQEEGNSPHTDATDDNQSDESDNETEPLPPLQPPTGTRYEMILSSDLSKKMILYADEDIFEYSGMGDGDDMLFTYRGTDSQLEVCMVYLPSYCQSILEGEFLNSSIFVEGTPVKESQQIGRSQLQGDYATVTNDEGTHEVWVHFYQPETNGDIGIAFKLDYSEEAQKDAFYNILNSVQIS